MTLLKKIITRYALITLLISSFGCTVKIYGLETGSLEWGVSARQGLRKTMEDQYSGEYLGDVCFFGIYDGHAGDKAAEFAKKNLYPNFSKVENKRIKVKLTSAFLRTDKDFLRDPEFKNDLSGTTAVVAVVDANTKKVVIANAGDSRAIVVRDGKVLLATKDHKPGKRSERERIKNAGGFVTHRSSNCSRVNGQLSVSRGIGDKKLKQWVILNPDIYEKSFKKGDFLVLACDGVWDVMNNEEVAVFVHERLDASDQKNLATHDSVKDTDKEIVEEDGDERIKLVARKLRDEAYTKHSKDNISVLIVRLGSTDGANILKRTASNVLKKHSSWITRLLESIKAKRGIILGSIRIVAISYALYSWKVF